jgi:excisionase family DNA binding protein
MTSGEIMEHTTTTPKRGRGRPRKYATADEARAAQAARLAARREENANRKRIAKADAEAAAQTPIDVLLITTRQAAAALSISERTIYTLIDSGHLSSVKVAGTRRIPLDAVKSLATTGTE